MPDHLHVIVQGSTEQSDTRMAMATFKHTGAVGHDLAEILMDAGRLAER